MRSRRGVRWHWKGSSYPPGRTEVYESEADEVVGFVFGVRGPAEGGGAGPILLLPPPRPARRSAMLAPIFLGGLKEEVYLLPPSFFCSKSETLARANRVGRKGACCRFAPPGVGCAS
jgi:hypothetical protein